MVFLVVPFCLQLFTLQPSFFHDVCPDFPDRTRQFKQRNNQKQEAHQVSNKKRLIVCPTGAGITLCRKKQREYVRHAFHKAKVVNRDAQSKSLYLFAMKKLFFVALLAWGSCTGEVEEKKEIPVSDSQNVVVVDQPGPQAERSADSVRVARTAPVFPGGIKALKKFFRNLPCVESVGFGAEEAYVGTDGIKELERLVLEFDSSGSLKRAEFSENLRNAKLERCLSRLKTMPRWEPATADGKKTAGAVILYLYLK
jgi:hypothetical protein